MKIYADTSVFGGVFDNEFSEASKQFFVEVDAGRFMLVTSAIVEAEIEPAPEKVRAFFTKYAGIANIAVANQEALELQSSYINSGVVTENSLEDALHVAVATVAKCDLIAATPGLFSLNILISLIIDQKSAREAFLSHCL